MLIWEKMKNTFATIGYSRAAAQLANQGRHDLAKDLMLTGIKETQERKRAIQRLERVMKAKRSYDPAKHYFRGKNVAFWRGHADA